MIGVGGGPWCTVLSYSQMTWSLVVIVTFCLSPDHPVISPRLVDWDPDQAQVRITDIKLRPGLVFPPSPHWRLQHSHHLCCCRKLAGIVAAADWQPEPTWIQIQVIMLVPHFITSLCPDSWLHSISIQELWMFILQPRNGSLGKPKWCEIISNCCQAVRYEQRTTQICLLICQKISKLAN